MLLQQRSLSLRGFGISIFGRFCQRLWPDSRIPASKLSSPQRISVAFSSNPGALLSAFPVCYQQHYRMQAKIVISRGLACAQNSGRLAKRVGFLPARYRSPLSAAELPSKSPHTPSALGSRSNVQ